MGYRWKIGNGRKVRFWEDLWFSTCSLAIQYWEIYSIINEQGAQLEMLGMVMTSNSPLEGL
jgi:hypothetical protein